MEAFWFNIGLILTSLVGGYLCGSIPWALIIGKVFYKKDPRDYGSKNLGGTNAGRLFGKKVGFLIIVLDMLKTIVPIWIMWLIMFITPIGSSELIYREPIRMTLFGIEGNVFQSAFQWYYLVAIGCIIGHCYPLFAGLKGGKGFSNFMGLMFGVNWMIGLFVGSIYFLVLKWKKYVSLSAIVAASLGALLSIATIFINPSISMYSFYGPTMVGGIEFAVCMTLLALFTIFKHRENIKRILNGTERKIKWMDSKKEKEARRLQEEQDKLENQEEVAVSN